MECWGCIARAQAKQRDYTKLKAITIKSAYEQKKILAICKADTGYFRCAFTTAITRGYTIAEVITYFFQP